MVAIHVQVHSKILCYDFFSILGGFDFTLRPFLSLVTFVPTRLHRKYKFECLTQNWKSQNVFDAISYEHFSKKFYIFDSDTLYKKRQRNYQSYPFFSRVIVRRVSSIILGYHYQLPNITEEE